jgi:hypothetical protein
MLGLGILKKRKDKVMETMVRDLGFVVAATKKHQRVFLAYDPFENEVYDHCKGYCLLASMLGNIHFRTIEEAKAARDKHIKLFDGYEKIYIFEHKEVVTLTEVE